MSLINEIPDIKEMNTTTAPEYKELLNRQLFEELTTNTSQILLVLSDKDEPNDVPKVEILSNKDEGEGLFAEEDSTKKMIRIRILTPDNRSKLSVDVSTNEKLDFAQPITLETYTKLESLVVDPYFAMTNAKAKIGNAI